MQIADLIESTNLLDYVSQYVEMEERGGEWFGICPFHSEKTPSFSISPRKNPNVYYCFGCGSTGNILSFAQKYHKVGFLQAVNMVKEWANIKDDIATSQCGEQLRAMRQFAVAHKEKKKPEYVRLADDYMARYSDDLDDLQLWLDEGMTADSLRKYEVRFDPLEDRIVYPLKNEQGHIVGVSGRTTDPDWKAKGLRKYTYTQKMGVVDFIYGMYESKPYVLQKKELILFEGAKSVIKCDGYGIHNAGAVLTSHLNEYQMCYLIRLGCAVVFALDKGIDITADKNINKLKQFVPVYYLFDKNGLLEEKDSPIDKGLEVFERLYEERRRLR